jgi:hypothetical protein
MLKRFLIPFWVIAGIAGFLFGFTGMHFPDLPFPTQTVAVFAMKSPWLSLVLGLIVTIALLFSSSWISIAIHEFGHLIIGALVNFEVQTLRIVSLSWRRTGNRWMFEFLPKSSLSGFYYGLPRNGQNLTGRMAFMVSGGALANFFVAALALNGLVQLGERENWRMDIAALSRIFLTFLFFANTFFAFTSLVPFRSKNDFKSDGFQLWSFIRGDPRVPRAIATLALFSNLRTGIKPRDWEPQLIETANALEDQSNEFATARFLRYAFLLDRGDTEAAGIDLDNAMTYIEKVSEVNRPGFWLEHANYLALHRNQPEAARRSFEEAAKYTVRPMPRLRAEAAIAFAEGDWSRVIEKASAALEDFKLWGEPVYARDDAEELRELMARAQAEAAV